MDFREWLLKKAEETPQRTMKEAGDAAQSAGDPNDTSERAAEHAADRHAAETEEYASGSSEHARAEAAKRATGPGKRFLRHSGDTHSVLKDVEDKYNKSVQYKDRAVKVWKSPHWYKLPTKVMTYLAGVVVSVGVAVGVVKVVKQPTPSPLVIVADAVQRVEDQVRLEQLRQGIERNGQLMAAIYDPAPGVPEQVPLPVPEPIPIPVEIARVPLRVDRQVAPGESAAQPQPIAAVTTARALIPQLTTPEAQTAAVQYIERAQAQGQQVGVTYRQWRPAPSSNPPTSISTRSIFGGHYITLNSYSTTP